ncbi:unnamed protein product [Amoebophrya sp. A25]|nr:unnamed protein product [Amoebophrya sp. A25]|eukprot:GSA25T00000642001.1
MVYLITTAHYTSFDLVLCHILVSLSASSASASGALLFFSMLSMRVASPRDIHCALISGASALMKFEVVQQRFFLFESSCTGCFTRKETWDEASYSQSLKPQQVEVRTLCKIHRGAKSLKAEKS